MATTTNIALNSRSMNNVILISDGNGTTIENGNIVTNDINSSSLTTGNITSNIFTCNGELRTNLLGPYIIPTTVSSLMGLLISYGNTLNNGSTDFTNFQSTYTSTKGGFNFWNKSSTQTLTNLAIIDNSQTYFKSQLIGCTSETPVNTTSIVNKTYVDSNFVRLINDQTVNGVKTFSSLPLCSVVPTTSNELINKLYADSKFETIADMVNYVDIATNNQIVSGSKIFNNDQSFKTAALIYDQTALSTKYMKLSQSIDTFTLQSQNGQASQFQVSLQNVGGAYNTILSMNSNQATVAGSLTVNSTFTSNSQATLKNSNTLGTVTTDVQTVNSWLDLKFRTRVYNLNGSGDHTQIYMIGATNEFIIYPIPYSASIQFYCKDSVGGEFNVFSFTALLNTCRVPLTCLQQATFNTVAPLCSIAPSSGNSLCNKTYVDSVGASSILASNNTFSGFNNFTQNVTIKDTLYLNSFTGGRQATFYLDTYGTVLISSDNASGKIQLNTHDSLGNSYNRVFINENEINLTVPITLTTDYTYYNPVNFGSNRLGYSTSNIGSTNTLTTATGNNSGQLNLPCGSWNITYTAIITVITGTLTSLNSLEVFIADSFNADLNIIGLDVLNYYKISTITVGQQIKISASGNIISYNNVNTQYNLRLIPIFVAGAGGLTFTGKISATRNA